MKASQLQEKLLRINEITQSFLTTALISKHQLLSLLGHLNFAKRIILQGCSFISCFLDLASSVPNLLSSVSLDEC